MQAIFDIGANNGSWGLSVAQQYPQARVFGFEPTPKLCDEIRQSVETLALKNYELVPYAVSDVACMTQFHVAGQNDWGCSSLLQFSDGLDQTWPGRKDFQVTQTIDVECIRLDKFVEERGITSIGFLHCDTQGTDLKVLSSLGRHIKMVEKGEIESASARKVALYKGQHTLEDVVIFFLQNGLEIERMTPNDALCNEVNILFQKRQ